MKNIKDALTGIEQAAHSETLGSPIIENISDPPTYFVGLLLRGIAGFEWSEGDRSAWQVNVIYKSVRFLIKDWKRSTWLISTVNHSSKTHDIARQLQRKIRKACEIMDKALSPELKQMVEVENFFVKNSYNRIRSLYEFFRNETEKALQEKENAIPKYNKDQIPEEIFDNGESNINLIAIMRIDPYFLAKNKAFYNTCSMVDFFFSYTELLFDILFAFNSTKTMTYHQFRNLSWKERFNIATNNKISKNPEIEKLYRKLLYVKDTWRDIVLHGFAGEEALLVPLNGVGLVPISYELTSRTAHLSPTSSEESIRQVLEVFLAFDNWVKNDLDIQYAVLYGESDLEIPFQLERLNEIRSWMTSRGDFENALFIETEMREQWMERFLEGYY